MRKLTLDNMEIDKMIDNLSKSNANIVISITEIGDITQEVTCSSEETVSISEGNRSQALIVKELLHDILNESKKLEQYI